MTIERKVTSSRMNAIERTNRNTIGRGGFIVSRKSLEDAVTPDTVTSAPGSLPTLAGTTLVRRTASEWLEAASVPLPFTAMLATATVLAGLTSTLNGSDS